MSTLVAILAVMATPAVADFGLFQRLQHEITGFDAIDGVHQVVFSADGRHLYSLGEQGIVIHALDPVDRSPQPQGLAPLPGVHHTFPGAVEMVLAADGRHLYALAIVDQVLNVYERDPAGGGLARLDLDTQGLLDELGDVDVLASSPDGRHFYALTREPSVAILQRNVLTGALERVGEEALDSRGLAVTLPDDGEHLYVARVIQGVGPEIRGYRRDSTTGLLELVDTLPPEDLGEVSSIDSMLISPDGEHLYAVGAFDPQANTRQMIFERNPVTGTLTRVDVPPADAPDIPSWLDEGTLAIDPSGTHLYNADGSILRVFERQTDGRLELVQYERVFLDLDPVIVLVGPLAMDPLAQMVLIPDGTTDSLVLFDRDSATGELAQRVTIYDRVGATLDGLGEPRFLFGTADGRDVYVLGEDNQDLVQYRRNESGVLQRGQAVSLYETGLIRQSASRRPFWSGVVSSSDDASQALVSFECAVGVDICREDLWFFERDPVEGHLRFLSRQLLARDIYESQYVFSPNGRFLFSNSGGYFLTVFRFNRATGAVSQLTRVSCDPSGRRECSSLAVSPDGRWLFTGSDSSSGDGATLRVWEWDAASETLSAVSSMGGDLGQQIHRLQTTPDGRYLIASVWPGELRREQGLVVYEIDRSVGTLAETQRLIEDADVTGEEVRRWLGPLSESGTRLVVSTAEQDILMSLDPGTGQLDVLDAESPVPPPANVFSLLADLSAWSPQGDQLYVLDPVNDQLLAFDDDPPEPCQPSATTLCLGADGRFRVEVAWRDFAGETGVGTRVLDSDDSGMLWFFEPGNWEMLVKVVDGCAFNGHHWVFAAATTNVEFTLTVTDTQGIEQAVYQNPLGSIPRSVADVEAFANCP